MPGEQAVYGEWICCGEPVSCGEWICCGERVSSGERACPALGCEAAPSRTPHFFRSISAAVLGLLRSPTRGKPAHHKKTVHHRKSHNHKKTVHHRNPDHHSGPANHGKYGLLCLVNRLSMVSKFVVVNECPVVSGLAPRWAAKRPHEEHRISSGKSRWQFWGCSAAQRGASPLTTKRPRTTETLTTTKRLCITETCS